ncbi:MAG: metallophosphoesterase [Acidobacteriota bacterium]|nr:metallophosphoesterase [Blastocatellia bacterium]MDW8240654.1 metallophosphoesterase [Acidobacteriota bacterium]
MQTLTRTLIEAARHVHNEARDIEIVQRAIYLPNLPAAFEGYTLVQLSDVHHGALVRADYILSAVAMINERQPDVVVLTGDYITHSRAYMEPCAELLSQLRAKDGVFAVLGNHEFWTDADKMTRSFKKHHIHVLRNTHTHLERKGERLALVGVDDSTTAQDDIRAALHGVHINAPTILLSHNPNVLRKAAHFGVHLILSGHTHGGQIRLSTRQRPPHRWLRFYHGYVQLGMTQLYINRGLGTVIVPVRYQCRPEITVIELKRTMPEPANGLSSGSHDDE